MDFAEEKVYSRDMTEPPKHIIENGRPVFGSFKSHTPKLDIRGVKHPFGVIPAPTFLTNLRIRSYLSYSFLYGDILGTIDILDAKFFGFAELLLWNVKTGKKYAYRNLMGPRRRLIPKNLESAICVTFKRSRYFRISWNRKAEKHSILFNMTGDSVRPDIAVAFTANLNSPLTAESTFVMPAPGMRRCAATYSLTSPIQGNISLQPKSPEEPSPVGLMLFNMRRAYYKLRTKTEYIIATGMLNGKCLTLSLSTSNISANDSDKYNENFLVLDGVTTPLPPVVITRPFGINQKWIIQDTESMIDLSFSPISDNIRTNSIFILRTQYHTIYGNYNGVLLTSTGEKLVLKDFAGIAKKHLLRL